MKNIKYFFLFLLVTNITLITLHSECWETQYYWQKISLPTEVNPNSYWLDIFFIDTLHGWACGQNTNQILRTSDGGNTWKTSTLPIPSYMYTLHSESIHFIDSLNGFCSGPSGIYKSTDGGASWQSISILNELVYDGQIRLWGCFMLSKDTIYSLGGGCYEDPPRLVWRSVDGGNTWQYIDLGDVPLPNSDRGTDYPSGLSDILVYKNGVGYISSSGLVWKTTNYGNSWNIWSSPNNYFAWQEEITNLEGTNVVLVPYAGNACNGSLDERIGGILWTSDGINWKKYSTNAAMFGTDLISMYEGWACGHYGSVYHTIDAGNTWEKTTCEIEGNLDDIFFLKTNSANQFGWVVGDYIYKLVPANASVNKDTIDLGTICSKDSFLDTVVIYNRGFNNQHGRYMCATIIDNPYFNIKMESSANMECYSDIPIIISFTPDSTTIGTTQIFSFAVNYQCNDGNYDLLKIDTIFYKINIKDSINISQDTINFGELIIGNTYKDSIIWFSSSNIKDSIKLINIVGNDDNYCTINLNDSTFYLEPDSLKNINFTVVPQDTGTYLIKYSFEIFPCYEIKDIYVKFSVINIPKIEISDSIEAEVFCKTDTIIAIPILNNRNTDLTISNLIINVNSDNIVPLGFGANYKNIPITIPPNKSDTFFVLLTSQIDTTYNYSIKIFHNDTTKFLVSPIDINIKATFRKVNVFVENQILNFGDICVGDSIIKNVSFISNGSIPFNFDINLNENPFYFISENNINVKQFDTINFMIKFIPNKIGTFTDTIKCITEPCGTKFYFIATGTGIQNNIDYSPTAINDKIKTKILTNYYINIKSQSPQNINIDSIIFNNNLEELSLITNFPFSLGGFTSTNIEFTAYSDSVKIINSNLQIYYSSSCSDSITIPINIEFYEDTINLIIRWDSVLNATPGDTISLTATIDSINFPLDFSQINFNINMDYKLFNPINLFVIDNETEYPINFDFKFSDGITATISSQELIPQKRLLRLEGITLLSNPTSTPVSFDYFNIVTDTKYNFYQKFGLLEVSNFCGNDWRGNISFMPEFNVKIDNIITEKTLNIDFNSTGKIEIMLKIIDINGNIIQTKKINLEEGNTNKQIKLNNIAIGKYFIVFSAPFNSDIMHQIIIK